MGLEWHYFLCIGSVFPFLCGNFSVILVILKYTGTGLLSPTVSLCPNGITRYSVYLTLFYILSYMQILTKLTATSIAVSACQQSNSHVQACVKGCCFVTARIVKFFGGEEHSPHPPCSLHICFLSLIPQCMWWVPRMGLMACLWDLPAIGADSICWLAGHSGSPWIPQAPTFYLVRQPVNPRNIDLLCCYS